MSCTRLNNTLKLHFLQCDLYFDFGTVIFFNLIFSIMIKINTDELYNNSEYFVWF